MFLYFVLPRNIVGEKQEDIMSIYPFQLDFTLFTEKWKKYRRVNSKIFQGKFAYPKSNNKNIYICTYLTETY